MTQASICDLDDRPPASIPELFAHWCGLHALGAGPFTEAQSNAIAWAQCALADQIACLTPADEREFAMVVIVMTCMGEGSLPDYRRSPELWDKAFKLAQSNGDDKARMRHVS